MKKVLIFLLLCISLFIVSCKEEEVIIIDDGPKPEYVEVTYVIDENESETVDVEVGTLIYPLGIAQERGDESLAGWATSLKGDLFDFSTPVESDLTLYAIWVKSADVTYYPEIIEEYIPDTITASLDLPKYQDNLKLIWWTSNQTVLSNYGVLNLPRKDTNLTVYLEIYDAGISTFYEKEVIVKACQYKPIKATGMVFGYYSTWNYFGNKEEFLEKVDCFNLSFAYVNQDFTLACSSFIPYINQVMEAHNAGVRVVLSVQGYGSEGKNFSNAASTAAGRTKLAKSMLEVVQKYNFDGIDIDWEYPGYGTGRSTAVDKANYTLLMQEINRVLKETDSSYLLTAAIPGGPYGPSRFDLGNVCKYLDYIHIMTYDLQGSAATHHTALYASSGTVNGCSVDESVQYYYSQGVPYSKMVIGIAFYGKATKASRLGASGNGYSSIVYTKLKDNYLSRVGVDVDYYYDETAEAPYLIDRTNGLFITYDNARSIKAKVSYANNLGLAGVMIWELGEDTSLELIDAI